MDRLTRVCGHLVGLPQISPRQSSEATTEPRVRRLRSAVVFGCSIDGITAESSASAAHARVVAAALQEHSVVVIRGLPLTDPQQVQFTRELAAACGTILEPVHVVGGLQDVQKSDVDSRYLSKISNLDADGQRIPQDDVKAVYNAGNQLWHSDSSFKKVSAMASCLAARAPMDGFAGGETEFVSGRLALRHLPTRLRVGKNKYFTLDDLRCLIGIHDLNFSRGLLVPQWGRDRPWATELPPSRHPLVAPSPSSWSSETLFIGAHLSAIEDLDLAEARELIRQLNTHATQQLPEFTIRHKWEQHDLVIYDNTCCLHRGVPWAVHLGAAPDLPRDMVRTTLMGKETEEEALGYVAGAKQYLAPPKRTERLALLKAVGVDFRQNGLQYYARVHPDMQVPTS